MTSNIIDRIINKGVPISTPIIIRYCDLYDLCNDKEEFKKTIDTATKRRNERLSKIVSMEDLLIYKSMSIKIDPMTLKKELGFSSAAFLYSIMKYLNYENLAKLEDEEDFKFDYINLDFEVLLPRINRLRQIRDDHKLKKEFPILYRRYNTLHETYKKIREMEKYIDTHCKTPNQKEEYKNVLIAQLRKQTNSQLTDDIFKEAKEFNVKTFCEKYANCFEDIVDNSADIIQAIEEESIPLTNVDVDEEKLELYLAYRFYENIRDEIDEDKQKYVYYLANYFKENKNRKSNNTPVISITKYDGYTPEKGKKEKETISSASLYQKFRKFIIDNPNIQLLDFNGVDFSKMTLAEVEVFIEEYLKTFRTNWELIPKGVQLYEPVGSSNRINKKIDYEKLKELFMQKKEFYSNLDPFMCIKGKKTFAGYIGYIFTNGVVVLDKFYENPKKGKVSRGDAIYYIDIQDFYELSRYPKRVLMQNPKVKRIIHKVNWQQEILNIISCTGDGMKTSGQVYQLIKNNKIYEDTKKESK